MAGTDESTDKGQHAGSMNWRVDAIGPTVSWEAASILLFDRRHGPLTADAPPGRGPGSCKGFDRRRPEQELLPCPPSQPCPAIRLPPARRGALYHLLKNRVSFPKIPSGFGVAS